MCTRKAGNILRIAENLMGYAGNLEEEVLETRKFHVDIISISLLL